MLKKRIQSYGLGFVLHFPVAFGLQAGETKTLQFVADSFPILVEDQGNGKICGIGPSLAKAAAESLGYRSTIEMVPLQRALKMIESGAKDGIISVYKTDERQKFLNFTSRPFFTDIIKIFSLKESPISWTGSINSLKPYRIGVLHGWYYMDRFKQLEKGDSKFIFDWIPQRESGFKMLLAKRIDVLISNERNYQDFLMKHEERNGKQDQTHDIVALNPPVETMDVFIAFSKAIPISLVQKFDKVLARLSKETKLKASSPSALPCPPL